MKPIALAISLVLASYGQSPPANAPKVRITQVDLESANRVRVYVSIADVNGNPIPDDTTRKLEIYESGKRVAAETISEGRSVYTVLVLDLSGSMAGEKLRQAKAAIDRYIDLAPAYYRIAVVGFSDRPRLVSSFTSDKTSLESGVQALSAGGNTALQDALAYALGLFHEEGRHAILLLTDGIENKSQVKRGPQGKQEVIQNALQQSATISVVGVGRDVDAAYLAGFEATGGSYLKAESPGELTGLFENAIGSVAKERVIEYTTQQNPDGLRERLEARLVSLEVGGTFTVTDRVEVVRHGFIPDIKGSLTPYFGGLLILLIAPGVWSIAGNFSSVRRFRSAHLHRLRSRSPHLGILDPNGVQLLAGDTVVMCPGCDKPHSVRSWRNNRCACMLEPHGRGNVCFHRTLPHWVRHGLNSLSRGRVTAMGRSWLCRCAGDKEGY